MLADFLAFIESRVFQIFSDRWKDWQTWPFWDLGDRAKEYPDTHLALTLEANNSTSKLGLVASCGRSPPAARYDVFQRCPKEQAIGRSKLLLNRNW